MINDLRALHRQALALADAHVADVGALDLRLATPCVGWSLADLLAHMIGQHRGIATAVGRGDAPVEAYAPVPFHLDDWRASIDELVAAFAASDLDRRVVEVELAPVPIPVQRVLVAQLIDTVVHTWDVARSRGGDFVPPDGLLEVSAEIAAAIPDPAYGPGAAFAQRLPRTGDQWADTLALAGRDASVSARPGRD